MDNLSLQPEQKKMSRQRSGQNERFDNIGTEDLLDLFPLPRYFQIHFSHVHDNCEIAKLQVNELRQSVDRVEQKLDQLLAALLQENI
ncbi:MAG: hypothetical protein ACU85E_12630 [Gammaproteobacteria bacterium]